MRPGATKGTLRRENKNLFFDVLCLITFHWSFKKNYLSSPTFDKVMDTSMFRNKVSEKVELLSNQVSKFGEQIIYI